MRSKEHETVGWYPTCRCDGLPALVKLPQTPKKIADADHNKMALEGWRIACAAVYAIWRKVCEAAASTKTVPAVVLDPFGGSGTTGMVADRLQRDAVLVELNPKYVELAHKRLKGDGGLFTHVAAE